LGYLEFCFGSANCSPLLKAYGRSLDYNLLCIKSL
jgi:hypothetical protein